MIEIPATLTALGTLVTAVGIILIAFWAYRGKERAAKAAEVAEEARERAAKAAEVAEGLEAHLVETDKGIFELGERVDGRLTELLRVNREKADAEIENARVKGIAQGEQAQRDRQTPPQP